MKKYWAIDKIWTSDLALLYKHGVILYDIHVGWCNEPALKIFRIHNGIHFSCGRLYIELCRLKCDGESQSSGRTRETLIQGFKATEEDR